MNRTFANLVIDLCAACLFLAMLLTGYILWFALPPETNKTFSLWGLTRHQWGAVHAWMSLGLIAIILVHLGLHWSWIVNVISKQFRSTSKTHPSLLRSALTCSMLLSLGLGAFAWAAQTSVRRIREALPGACPPDAQSESNATGERIIGDTPQGAVRFWQDVYPVFEANCLSCHGLKRQLGDFRVDRGEDFFKTVAGGPLVVPGNSAGSRLIELVSGPDKNSKLNDKHKLEERDVLLLKAWIDAGADWPADKLAK
jgi:hypothetical protein